jgi:enoyl-CoA hydratase
VVEKDRNPRWKPATLAEVDAADVEAYFASLGERELGLGGVRAAAENFSQPKETDHV